MENFDDGEETEIGAQPPGSPQSDGQDPTSSTHYSDKLEYDGQSGNSSPISGNYADDAEMPYDYELASNSDGEDFVCSICHQSFGSDVELESHMATEQHYAREDTVSRPIMAKAPEQRRSVPVERPPRPRRNLRAQPKRANPRQNPDMDTDRRVEEVEVSDHELASNSDGYDFVCSFCRQGFCSEAELESHVAAEQHYSREATNVSRSKANVQLQQQPVASQPPVPQQHSEMQSVKAPTRRRTVPTERPVKPRGTPRALSQGAKSRKNPPVNEEMDADKRTEEIEVSDYEFASNSDGYDFICSVCRQSFNSEVELENHIAAEQHFTKERKKRNTASTPPQQSQAVSQLSQHSQPQIAKAPQRRRTVAGEKPSQTRIPRAPTRGAKTRQNPPILPQLDSSISITPVQVAPKRRASPVSTPAKRKPRIAPVPSFFCNVCPQAFTKEHLLKVHAATHIPQPVFQCPQCQAQFTTKNKQQRHMVTAHGNRTRKATPKTSPSFAIPVIDMTSSDSKAKLLQCGIRQCVPVPQIGQGKLRNFAVPILPVEVATNRAFSSIEEDMGVSHFLTLGSMQLLPD